ncbi:hypothetical protein [Arthrobacter sp.]|uniref:hypothetical protein n=1 Tax=Arthrobacter sp. TaxID=1667 RepID=UPI0026E094CB|nr:hypothetical protein [Arthrobacter sp.]MDO5752253.1 hypothetical protein [Arthrobacter sp.]
MSKKPAGAHAAPPGKTVHPSKRSRGYYKSEVEREALRQGMTVEEYGVYKGSVGSAVKPVNSAGGLLAISLLISVIYAFCLVFFVIHWAQDGPQEALKNAIPLLLAGIFVPWSWVYFAREHKASKLRKARGITLIRPE